MFFQPKTVLIAEDELLVRIVAAAIFVDAGFEVIEADCAEEALEALNSRAAEIDLLFTDINMPGHLDGLQLARQVHEAWPDSHHPRRRCRKAVDFYPSRMISIRSWCRFGTVQSLGRSSRYRKLLSWFAPRIEQMAKSGSERTIVNRATNLKHRISAMA